MRIVRRAVPNLLRLQVQLHRVAKGLGKEQQSPPVRGPIGSSPNPVSRVIWAGKWSAGLSAGLLCAAETPATQAELKEMESMAVSDFIQMIGASPIIS